MGDPFHIAGTSGFRGDRNDALRDPTRNDAGDPDGLCNVGPIAQRPDDPLLVSRHLAPQGSTGGYGLLRMAVEVPDGPEIPDLVGTRP